MCLSNLRAPFPSLIPSSRLVIRAQKEWSKSKRGKKKEKKEVIRGLERLPHEEELKFSEMPNDQIWGESNFSFPK